MLDGKVSLRLIILLICKFSPNIQLELLNIGQDNGMLVGSFLPSI